MKYIIFLSLLVILVLLIWIGKDINLIQYKKKSKKIKNNLQLGGVMCLEVAQLPIDLKSLDDSLSRYFNNLDTDESSDNDRNISSDLFVKSKLLRTDDQRFEVISRIDKHLLHDTKSIYLVTYYPQGSTISIYDITGNEIGTQRAAEDDSGQFDYKKNSTYIETIYDIAKQTDEDRVIKAILKQNHDIKDITKYNYDNDYYYLASSLEDQSTSSVFNSSGGFFNKLYSSEVIGHMGSDGGKFRTDWDEKASPVEKIYQHS